MPVLARTIAIIDDDASLRRAMARLLGARGYQTMQFGSAEELLASPDGLGADCLLLDIDLPGMSGIELSSHFLLWPEPPPVIFISGQAGHGAHYAIDALEAVARLTKPVESFVLFDAIERALAAPRKRGLQASVPN
jgi:FixJ family two-component response regulator